jgi:hypothetical protein
MNNYAFIPKVPLEYASLWNVGVYRMQILCPACSRFQSIFRLKNEVKFIYKFKKFASLTAAEEKFQSSTRLEMAAC